MPTTPQRIPWEERFSGPYFSLLAFFAIVTIALPTALRLALPLLKPLLAESPYQTQVSALLTEVQNIYVPTVVGSTALIIILFMRPVLRSIEDIRDTRREISRLRYIEKNIANLTDVAIDYHEDITEVIDMIVRSELVWLDAYMGFYKVELARMLVRLSSSNGNIVLYVHPRMLPAILKGDTAGTKIFVTDCPREACVIVGGKTLAKRKKKRVWIIRSEDRGKTCWSATIKPGSRYAKYLEKTYRDYYQAETAVQVTSNIKGHFLSVLHEGRTEQNKDIFTGFLTFPIRQMGYAFARQLFEHATTIQAVDFMEPGTWLAEPMVSYAEAQGRNTQAKKKERIHIFEASALKSVRSTSHEEYGKLQKRYEDFIDQQKRIGFSLYFRDKAGVDLTGGFLIIDEKVAFHVFREEKTHYEQFRIEDRATFDERLVNEYIFCFNRLRHDENTISVKEFVKEYMNSPRGVRQLSLNTVRGQIRRVMEWTRTATSIGAESRSRWNKH